MGGRQLGKLTFTLLQMLSEKDVPENIPNGLLEKFHLVKRFEALKNIHFPASKADYEKQ